MIGNTVGDDIGIAVFVALLSAIHRITLKKRFAVIEDMTITGGIKTTLSSFLNSLENIISILITKPEDAFLKGRLEEQGLAFHREIWAIFFLLTSPKF